MRSKDQQIFSRFEVSMLPWAPLMDSSLFDAVLLFFCGGKTFGMDYGGPDITFNWAINHGFCSEKVSVMTRTACFML